MTTTISRNKGKEATSSGAGTIVEVLDEKRFDQFHLPDAVNVPWGDGFDQRIQAAVPDKDEKVILYCQDEQCPASSKAAQRMESLGYRNLYDYDGGKMDWKQAGLPVES